jgi:hypothetical protein
MLQNASSQPTQTTVSNARHLSIYTLVTPAFLLCFPLQNPVDDEEHLDYSSGNVTIIPDLKSWEHKLEDASEDGKTVSILQTSYNHG